MADEGEYEEGDDQDEDGEVVAASGEVRGSGEIGAGPYNSKEVNDQVFEELHMHPAVVEETQGLWTAFLQQAESREAVGEAIYSALFDAAPSLQSLFKTPRAVMAMRFMSGLNQLVNTLHDPPALKILVETLGFQHLDLEVTAPRVVIFRDAICELLELEMGARFTPRARDGWATFLHYVGGAYIYVRVQYAERLQCLATSWAQANNRTAELAALEGGGEEEASGGDSGHGVPGGASADNKASKKPGSSKSKSWFNAKSVSAGVSGTAGESSKEGSDFKNTAVPKNFTDMFAFNAAVMGFGGSMWMQEILASFDAIVTNAANSYRLQEECDVLSLRMAKFKGNINLAEYKSVMLASLRSLVSDWGSLHEISWSWLWENVARMLMTLMGKPATQEAALARLLTSLDENSLMFVRREVYAKFFMMAPAGQDYFKQSTTRLHFIADKVVSMTLDMYREPKRMVEDISALGLRHVGYGIPTDLFGSFVTACVQVLRSLTDDDVAETAFRWSLNLISRILTRVINEGSTIVMKAINGNSGKQLRKAVSCAPRGQRALWMLNVQVGTQSISPLMWAIETGGLEAAKAIIEDLLTIRADRDRYYYGMDAMFERHPDIIKRLCADAPALLPVLLDGLIWRSRVTDNGQRRVNYYIKHLVIDANGGFSPTTEWLVDNGDPRIVCHPVVSMVTDMVWTGVAFRTFLYGRAWFMFTLSVFIVSQSLLPNIAAHETDASSAKLARVMTFACRIFVYTFSMCAWLVYHGKSCFRDCREGNLVKVWKLRIPEYMCNWQDQAALLLTACLVLMLCLEPILHCISSPNVEQFTSRCPETEDSLWWYSVISTSAMLLYFLLLIDLAVFSTRVSAFVLVCGRVISEVALFIFSLVFFALAFACGIAALEQDSFAFDGVPKTLLNLLKVTLGMFSTVHYDSIGDFPALFIVIVAYIIITVVFLMNLLIAQLNCAYQSTYQDMLGFARLNRGKIVYETMPSVTKKRWNNFVDALRLEDRIEFGEGDIGLAGGVQMWEPAGLNNTTVDMIRRFGGSTSPAAQWPAEESRHDDEDRFERLERQIEKAMKRSTKRATGGGSAAGGSSVAASSAFDAGAGDSSTSN